MRPGGRITLLASPAAICAALLLLHIRDRDCAVALIDRRLPRWARRLLWARLASGRPGPFPAVYAKAASDRGIRAYLQLRGLIITQSETERTLPDGPDRLARTVSWACHVIARLTRGRLTHAHDEVLYVIRKPEDRFARVV